MKTLKPLHGEKTHPLSEMARSVLAQISRRPMPRGRVNPGVVNRLLREALVEVVEMDSPFKTVKGKVAHLRITQAGWRVIT